MTSAGSRTAAAAPPAAPPSNLRAILALLSAVLLGLSAGTVMRNVSHNGGLSNTVDLVRQQRSPSGTGGGSSSAGPARAASDDDDDDDDSSDDPFAALMDDSGDDSSDDAAAGDPDASPASDASVDAPPAEDAAPEDFDIRMNEDGTDLIYVFAGGRQVSVDVKNASPSLLGSADRVLAAVASALATHDLFVDASNCVGRDVGGGLVCGGVAGRCTFHALTFPVFGVASVGVVCRDDVDIVDLYKAFRESFGVRADPVVGWDDPAIMWNHRLRGFPSMKNFKSKEQFFDLGIFFLYYLAHNMKERVATVQTKFQRIDVYDFITQTYGTALGYNRSISSPDSYEAQHPELYQPNRVVFLDGVLQSMSRGDAEYHEALVQPAMFAHGHVKKAAIIGGGEGATLREVLKHKSLEYAAMVEIDKDMVDASREHLPAWSDCSDLIGSADSCIDDPRADVIYTDAMAWFIDRYSPECDCASGKEHRYFCECGADYYTDRNPKDGHERVKGDFDVVIMDALDPTDDKDFTEYLYHNDRFLESMFDSLSVNGVIVMQLGETNLYDDASDEIIGDHNRANVIRVLERYGFESLHVYDEDRCGFFAPWSYLLACKTAACNDNFHANPAQVDLAIHQQILRTKSGKHPLRYFDGTTMGLYQVPAKAWELSFCRKVTNPAACYADFYDSIPKKANAGDDVLLGLDVAPGTKNYAAEMGDGLEGRVAQAVEELRRGSEEAMAPLFRAYNPLLFRRLQHVRTGIRKFMWFLP